MGPSCALVPGDSASTPEPLLHASEVGFDETKLAIHAMEQGWSWVVRSDPRPIDFGDLVVEPSLKWPPRQARKGQGRRIPEAPSRRPGAPAGRAADLLFRWRPPSTPSPTSAHRAWQASAGRARGRLSPDADSTRTATWRTTRRGSRGVVRRRREGSFRRHPEIAGGGRRDHARPHDSGSRGAPPRQRRTTTRRVRAAQRSVSGRHSEM